jgi:hypothetical protein
LPLPLTLPTLTKTQVICAIDQSISNMMSMVASYEPRLKVGR